MAANVDVHQEHQEPEEEDDDDEDDEDEEEEDEEDAEADEYLNKYINKHSKVRSGSGGVNWVTTIKRVTTCLTYIFVHRS